MEYRLVCLAPLALYLGCLLLHVFLLRSQYQLADIPSPKNDTRGTALRFAEATTRGGPSHINPPAPSAAFLTVKCDGRLGNELLQYAALYAFSRQYPEWTPCVRPGEYPSAQGTFQNLTILNDKVPCPDTSNLETSIFPEVTYRILRNHTSQNLTLLGFFQSHKYFDSVENDLRKEFAFTDIIQQKVQEFFQQVRPVAWANSSYVRVGIQVRRTDQLTSVRMMMGNIEHPPSYFRHAMAYFEESHPRVQFIVASDDLGWCRKHLTADNVVFSAKDAILDFAVMASCDDVIISLGSYSWWIGWICRGTTVYYGVSPKNGTYMGDIHSNNSWIPPPESTHNKWIPIV